MRRVIVNSILCLMIAAVPIFGRAQSRVVQPNLTIMVSPYSGGCSVTVSALGISKRLRLESRLRVLASKLGGRMVRFAEHKGELPPALAKQYPGLVEAQAELQVPPVYFDHSVDLNAWISAFGDTESFDLLIMSPMDPQYSGLRQFDRPGLSIRLTKDGAPFRFRVLCTEVSGVGRPVPVRQEAASVEAREPQRIAKRQVSSRFVVGLGMAAFALVGLVVLGVALVRRGAGV